MSKNKYYDREIEIEEMPQGCVLNWEDNYVVVSSPDDALAIIESLKTMLQVKYPEIFAIEKP
jgi:hypothetical protein